MNIEDRQKIAEWLGLIWVDRLHVKYGPDSKYSGHYCDGTEFDPWNKHYQFTKVWKKLKVAQRLFVCEKLKCDMGHIMESMKFVNMLLEDLPKVMQAALEVIKESVK